MPTAVKENYLKALYLLDMEDGHISMTELSNRLKVSKPTANHMVKSLQEQGWVIYQKYQPLQLTDQGRLAAAKIIRKHRLTEMFLSEVMGFGWEEVHEIAEQMEHIDSDRLFARMDEMLDYPPFDPHGSPIPDKDGLMTKQPHRALIHISPGTKVHLVALAKSTTKLLHYLNDCQIELGTLIELVKIEPFDESCLIRIADRPPFSISRKVAESLLVQIA